MAGPCHRAIPPAGMVDYYGCRTCGRSANLLFAPQGIVAVLDEEMRGIHQQVGETVRVNWLRLKQPFDCHAVEVVQASDEIVERFAMQFANDYTAGRPVAYRHMTYQVTGDISAQARRVLAEVFKEDE